MTDRELLELAAKAAGGLIYVDELGWIAQDADGNRGAWWNPLIDDGDALRLAVRLVIDISPSDVGVQCWVPDKNQAASSESWCWPPENADRAFATRRAIVRAAAEIGKTL